MTSPSIIYRTPEELAADPAFIRFIRCLPIILSFFAEPVYGQTASQATNIKSDQYGGSLTVVGKATGWFHLETIGGRSWLVTPAGHGFVSLGVNHIGNMLPAGRPVTSDAVQTISANLQRGGYNTWGYESPVPTDPNAPFFGSLLLTHTGHYHQGKDFWFDDVFDPAYQQSIRAKIRNYCGRMAPLPNLIGYYWTDTPEWDLALARKSRGTDWVSSLRSRGSDAPGEMRYIDFLNQTYAGDIKALNQAYGMQAPSFDWLTTHDFNPLDQQRAEVQRDDELFLQLIARELYRVTAEAFREADPNHLLFGERYKMNLHPDVVLKEAMRYIDVLSIQPGPENGTAHGPGKDETEFNEVLFDRLHQLTGKPIIVCDHSLSFYTPTYPRILWNQYPDPKAAALGYQSFLTAAMAKPYMIGFQQCQFISVFRTERNHLKQGLLDINGTPYAEFIDRLGDTNRRSLDQRYRNW